MMISKETQSELRTRFNPEGSPLRNLQLRLIEMLKYIDSVCQKENIPYWLGGGNALGLARHNGFIPWDDDLDIEMKAEDYYRLRKAILLDKESPYKWQDATTDKYFIMHYAKLRDLKSEIIEPKTDFYQMRGVFIDIFPLDYSTHFMTKYSTMARRILEGIVWHMCPRKFRRRGVLLVKTFLHKGLYPTWSYINKPFRSKKYMYHYPTSIGKVFNPYDIENIFPLKRANFEGIEVNIPGNLEEYLNEKYGDWEKIPPINTIHVHLDASKIKFFE